jgi:hypothetical protein
VTTQIGRGWATVDLDRAEGDLRDLIAADGVFRDAPRSGVLGARCRRARAAHGDWIVLLEPDTEGRLAAFLARNGEGWAATWVHSDAAGANEAATGRPLDGPFGPEALAADQPGTGRSLLVVTAATIDE